LGDPVKRPAQDRGRRQRTFGPLKISSDEQLLRSGAARADHPDTSGAAPTADYEREADPQVAFTV
jgi:hypothetical protein